MPEGKVKKIVLVAAVLTICKQVISESMISELEKVRRWFEKMLLSSLLIPYRERGCGDGSVIGRKWGCSRTVYLARREVFVQNAMSLQGVGVERGWGPSVVKKS